MVIPEKKAWRVELMAKKLSERAEMLLGIVREACILLDDGSGKPLRYFVPQERIYREVYGERIETTISGSGDARILKAFVDAGLTRPMSATPYACCITEEGLLAYECIADQRRKKEG